MRIISWNCNGAFRNKYEALNQQNADLLVIAESESPEYLHQRQNTIPAESHLWCGTRSCKGLSLFSKNGFHIKKAAFFNPAFRHILPATITTPNGKEFLLIGVWASTVQENHEWDYIGQMCVFMESFQHLFPEKTILIGDLNSNMQWNSYYKKEHNFSHFLELMQKSGFISLYHHFSGDAQGHEKLPTSYYHRDPQRGFHIDYAFSSQTFLKDIEDFHIETSLDWLNFSDHLPLFLQLKN